MTHCFIHVRVNSPKPSLHVATFDKIMQCNKFWFWKHVFLNARTPWIVDCLLCATYAGLYYEVNINCSSRGTIQRQWRKVRSSPFWLLSDVFLLGYNLSSLFHTAQDMSYMISTKRKPLKRRFTKNTNGFRPPNQPKVFDHRTSLGVVQRVVFWSYRVCERRRCGVRYTGTTGLGQMPTFRSLVYADTTKFRVFRGAVYPYTWPCDHDCFVYIRGT